MSKPLVLREYKLSIMGQDFTLHVIPSNYLGPGFVAHVCPEQRFMVIGECGINEFVRYLIHEVLHTLASIQQVTLREKDVIRLEGGLVSVLPSLLGIIAAESDIQLPKTKKKKIKHKHIRL